MEESSHANPGTPPLDSAALPAPDPVLPVWHGSLAYDGTHYHGWQIQPGVKTVQGELTRRLRILFACETLRIAGTSRTDAGVHAIDQHFSFPDLAPGRFQPDALRSLLNRWLPPDIRVRSLCLEPPGFNARHACQAKAYTYLLRLGETTNPFDAAYAWRCPQPLDLPRMRAATTPFLGQHDFTAVAAASGRQDDNPVKTLHRLDLIDHPPYLAISVIGNSFLYKMVRSIVGFLVHGPGQNPAWTPDAVAALLATARRNAAVPTAPPHGLFLARAFFADHDWPSYQAAIPPFHPDTMAHAEPAR